MPTAKTGEPPVAQVERIHPVAALAIPENVLAVSRGQSRISQGLNQGLDAILGIGWRLNARCRLAVIFGRHKAPSRRDEQANLVVRIFALKTTFTLSSARKTIS